MNINELNSEVYDSYKKDEKLTTDFELTDDSDNIKKAYLYEKLLTRNCNLSLINVRNRLQRI